MNLAEAEALCAHLEERSDIAYAWVYSVWNVDTAADETQTVLSGAWFNERGDMDGDKVITMKDAMQALKLSDNANLFDDSLETYAPVADIDLDGNVTMKDAMYILRYADELNLGYEPTWYELLEK
jgi:hypothetical protein